MSAAVTFPVAIVIRTHDMGATGTLRAIGATAASVFKDMGRSSLFREKAKEAMGATQALGMGMAATGAGMVASLAAPVAAATEFESVMTRASLPFMKTGGMDPVWKEIQPVIERLGQKLPGTSADMGEMAGNMRSAGLAATIIRDGGLEAAASLKVLGRMTNEEAGFLTANLSRALDITGGDFVKFADLTQRTSFATGIAIREIATAVPYMGAQVKQLGLGGYQGAEGISTAMAMLKDAGVGGSEIGTAVGGLLDRLPILEERLRMGRGWKAQEGAGLLQKYGLADIGKQVWDEKGSIRGGNAMEKWATIIGVFDQINTRIANTRERSLLLDELLGDVAKRAGTAFTVQNWNAARDKLNEQADLNTRLAAVLGTQAAAWEAATGTGRIFLATIAEPLLPILKGATGLFNAVTGKLAQWNREHPALTKAIAGTVGIAGILLVVVGGLTLGIGLLGKLVLTSMEGFAAWKGMLLLARQSVRGLGDEALLTGTKLQALNVSTLGVGPVRGALSMDGLNRVATRPIKDITLSVGPGLRMLDRFKAGWNSDWYLKPFRGSSYAGLGTGLTKVIKAPFTGSFWKTIGGGLKTGGSWLKNLLPATGANTLFSGSGLMGAFKGGGLALKAVFLAPLKGIGAVVAALGWPIIAIIAAVATAGLLIYKYWEPIKAFFKGVWEGFKDNIDLVKPAWDGFTDAVGGVFKALMSIVDIFVPVQAGQEGVNGAMEKGKAVGEALAWTLGIIVQVAKWVAQGVEAVVIGVVTMVDVLVTAAKTIWNALSGNWKDIGKDWSGFSDRFWKRLENSSMNPDKPAATEAVEKAAGPGKSVQKAGGPEAVAGVPGAPKVGAPAEGATPKLADLVKGSRGSGPRVELNYSPKLEIHGTPTPENKAWFERQLEEHRRQILRMVEEGLASKHRWNPLPAGGN